jgi:hypothetical protein
MTLPDHPYRPMIERICLMTKPVPPDVIEAMMLVESNAVPSALSPSGAMGLLQIIYKYHAAAVDKAATDLGKRWGELALYDPEINLLAGTRILRWCYTSDGSQSWERAVRKYHSGSADPPPDFQDGLGTTSDQHIAKFRASYAEVTAIRAPKLLPTVEEPMAITFGKVPIYGYVDRFIAAKRQGFGWDDLGPRNIKFITLHRMVGTLRGTDGYFRDPNIASYTDFGVAIAASDPAIPGHIYLWNYPNGRRAPWASGPVSAPYGDGKAIVDKYGINAVNRDGISLEIGGTNEVIDAFSWNEIVWFVAYWADQCKVPHTSFPLNPATGISFLVWHQEFTIGSGKKCPFQYLMDNTNRLITDVKAMLKKYQEGNVAGPITTPPPAPPVEEKIWTSPSPVRELALLEPNNAPFFTTVNGTDFEAIFDEVECIRQTPQKRYAVDGPVSDSNKVIGPDLKPGNRMTATYRFKNDKGTRYLYLSNHARVLEADFKRIGD